MASYPLLHAPLRRFAARARPWPLALLMVLALTGCGTGEDLDWLDPALHTDAAGSASESGLLTPQASTEPLEPAGVLAGAAERPAPPAAIPSLEGKPR